VVVDTGGSFVHETTLTQNLLVFVLAEDDCLSFLVQLNDGDVVSVDAQVLLPGLLRVDGGVVLGSVSALS